MATGTIPCPSNIQIKRLWTNSSPTSEFTAKTVSLTLSDYDAVMIIFLANANTSRQTSTICIMGAQCMLVSSVENSGNVRTRRATVSSTGVTFTAGYNDATTANASCIPYKIYGIKGIT